VGLAWAPKPGDVIERIDSATAVIASDVNQRTKKDVGLKGDSVPRPTQGLGGNAQSS
jgi:hypothetical protein